MLYDSSKVCDSMRQWFTVTLGSWHPYKQANLIVWGHWGQRWFGPLFHDLIPNGKFFKSPRLITVATFFTYVRLAYPYFRNDLKNAMAKSKGDTQVPATYAALLDLHQLLEFFIPVVCDVNVVCLACQVLLNG
jgi:hypothetical protein